MLRSAVCLFALVALAPTSSAQPFDLAPDLSLALNGGIQPRVSLGVEEADVEGDDAPTRYGVGLRRARIQARLTYREMAGVEYDVEGGSGDIQSVDLFAFANVAEGVQARIGYFPVPQPRGAVSTPYSLIDAVDRAAVAERWMDGTVGGDGRDLGVGVTVSRGRATGSLAVHNGSGTFDRRTGNYREGISGGTVVSGPETTGLAYSAAASYAVTDAVEIGAFASVNDANPARTSRGSGGRDYLTGGAHVYWGAEPGSQPVRLKLDVLAIRYAEDGFASEEGVGVSALAALRVLRHGEVFARAEGFLNGVEGEFQTADDGYFVAGLSYSPSAARGGPYHRARITAGYHVRRSEIEGDAHLVIVQGQLAF